MKNQRFEKIRVTRTTAVMAALLLGFVLLSSVRADASVARDSESATPVIKVRRIPPFVAPPETSQTVNFIPAAHFVNTDPRTFIGPASSIVKREIPGLNRENTRRALVAKYSAKANTLATKVFAQENKAMKKYFDKQLQGVRDPDEKKRIIEEKKQAMKDLKDEQKVRRARIISDETDWANGAVADLWDVFEEFRQDALDQARNLFREQNDEWRELQRTEPTQGEIQAQIARHKQERVDLKKQLKEQAESDRGSVKSSITYWLEFTEYQIAMGPQGWNGNWASSFQGNFDSDIWDAYINSRPVQAAYNAYVESDGACV